MRRDHDGYDDADVDVDDADECDDDCYDYDSDYDYDDVPIWVLHSVFPSSLSRLTSFLSGLLPSLHSQVCGGHCHGGGPGAGVWRGGLRLRLPWQLGRCHGKAPIT